MRPFPRGVWGRSRESRGGVGCCRRLRVGFGGFRRDAELAHSRVMPGVRELGAGWGAGVSRPVFTLWASRD